jgi:hypothetical protein
MDGQLDPAFPIPASLLLLERDGRVFAQVERFPAEIQAVADAAAGVEAKVDKGPNTGSGRYS